MRNNVTFSICKSKSEYLKLLFDKNHNNNTLIWKGIWQLITIISKRKVHLNIVKLKGKDITNPTKIANAFNNFFINIGPNLSKTILDSSKPFKNFLKNNSLNSFLLKATSEDEVHKLICQLNKGKALGPLSIPVTILKDNVNILSTPLSFIINRSFEQGVFPESLKTAQVTPVHKKEDTLTINNYRPISLLSVFSKILEKSMYNRIYSFLCKHKLINTTQFGFRSKHSTEHALISLIETIKKYLDDGEIVCGVFIDLQKAFDTLNHEILLEKLKHYGIRSKQNDWFRSFLTNRKQYVSMEGFFSQTKIVKCGVPQASTLGPLLFLIYINNLANALEKSIVHHFADDTNLLYGNKNPSVISDVINSELKLVTDWLRANKLSLNESKTKLLPFRSINKTEFNII